MHSRITPSTTTRGDSTCWVSLHRSRLTKTLHRCGARSRIDRWRGMGRMPIRFPWMDAWSTVDDIYNTHIAFTRIEYGNGERLHTRDTYSPSNQCPEERRLRPSASPFGRWSYRRANERTNDDDDDGSLLRAHLFHRRVRPSLSLLFSSRLDRTTRVIVESFIARIHRSYRARSYLERAIDDGDAGWMTRAWGRIERSRDARDEEGNVCSNA